MGLVRQAGFNIRFSCNGDNHREIEKLKESLRFLMLYLFDHIKENFESNV